MSNQQNSNSNVIKYFLIITAITFAFNFLYSLMFWGGTWSILSMLTGINLIATIPFIGRLYYSLVSDLFHSLGIGYWNYTPILLFHIIFGLAANYGIAFMIVNKRESADYTTRTVLTVGDIVKNSFKIAQNNIGVILLASLLWILTIWIPYINVGTTIGLWALIVGLSKEGTTISATSIFDSKHRKYMGELFLLLGFITLGMSMGYMFFIIPGIVISFAWGQAVYILIDKELTPLESIKFSNDITYGEKFTIFLGYLSLSLLLFIPIFLIGLLIGWLFSSSYDLLPIVMTLFTLSATIISFVVMISSNIYIYGALSSKLTNE